ncbi:MAG: restriction endonuclease [Bacillota bacterium]|nr:restriction endonuclease [Bacillota bacterium]
MDELAPNIWGVHAEKSADVLFLKKGFVALGWPETGDLSGLPGDRDAFKARVAASFPGMKPAAVPYNSGQLFRFAHEVKIGDLVAFPTKGDRQIHIGRIEGPYTYSPDPAPGYPHHRTVKWLKAVPRSSFTQGALYELGAFLSLFMITTYPHEYMAALASKEPAVTPAVDETVGVIAEDVQENTRDFVIKRLAQELKGHPFAEFVAHLLQTMGYRTRVSEEGPDAGVDIIAHRDELGFEPPIIKVQVKSSLGNVGGPTVQALYGNVEGGEYGLLVTLGTFTHQARTFARSKMNLRLIDGGELVNMILAHYEQFDSKYKGLIPLKRVYIPQAIIE